MSVAESEHLWISVPTKASKEQPAPATVKGSPSCFVHLETGVPLCSYAYNLSPVTLAIVKSADH